MLFSVGKRAADHIFILIPNRAELSFQHVAQDAAGHTWALQARTPRPAAKHMHCRLVSYEPFPHTRRSFDRSDAEVELLAAWLVTNCGAFFGPSMRPDVVQQLCSRVGEHQTPSGASQLLLMRLPRSFVHVWVRQTVNHYVPTLTSHFVHMSRGAFHAGHLWVDALQPIYTQGQVGDCM